MSVRLYAVLRLRRRSGTALPRGLQGERLKILTCAGCSVAVADTRRTLEPAVQNLLGFDRVICALAEMSEAILPARFGTVAPSAATLKSEIAERAGALVMALDKVAGRVQMTVRLPAGPKGPALRRPGPSGPGKGSAYLRTRAAVSRPLALTKLRDALADLVRDERIEPGPEGMIVYHLIDRGDVAAYLARFENVRVSGPFPPYAFVPCIQDPYGR
jgi:hypothetical protein